MYTPASEEEVETIFAKKMAGEPLTAREIDQYKMNLLVFLGREYHRLDWVMQLHYGCESGRQQRKQGGCLNCWGRTRDSTAFPPALRRGSWRISSTSWRIPTSFPGRSSTP